MDRVAHRGPLVRAPGALKGDTSEIINIFVAVEGVLSQNIKKLKEETLWEKEKFPEKSLAVPKKKLEGGPFGLAGYGMLRGKTGKTFLVQFARPNSAFWCNNIL